MNNIYLVGFMATGKSAVGKELARKKKLRFLDLDELIELRERRTISDIFAKDGEPCFRRIEKRTLKEVAREKSFVVACGGGIVIDPENIRIMKDSGKVICLQATPEVILKRAYGCRHRPLLNVADPGKQIDLLLKLRAPYYARADKTIDTSKLTVEQVVEKIIGVTQSPVPRAPGHKSQATSYSLQSTVHRRKPQATGHRLQAKRKKKVKKNE
jgi:shikimate kinase